MTCDGQSFSAADVCQIYLTKLNEFERVYTVDPSAGAVYAGGESLGVGVTTVLSRLTGEVRGVITNRTNNQGATSNALYVKDGILAQITPGCCGTGVSLYDTSTLTKLCDISESFADSVAITGNMLIIGTESGIINVFDISDPTSPKIVTGVDLHQLTGRYGLGDVEVRALWVDDKSGLLFAATSWGDPNTGDTTLPNFFVFQLK